MGGIYNAILGVSFQISGPAPVHLIILFQYPDIAVLHIEIPRNQRRSCRHRVCRTRAKSAKRGGIGQGAAYFSLSIPDVSHPLGIQGRKPKIVEGAVIAHSHIVDPSQAFVSLRTVCRNTSQIADFRPHHIALKLVDHRIGCGKTADLLHIGTDHTSDHCVLLWRLVKPLYIDIAEPMEGEGRLIDPIFSIKCIGIGCLCIS